MGISRAISKAAHKAAHSLQQNGLSRLFAGQQQAVLVIKALLDSDQSLLIGWIRTQSWTQLHGAIELAMGSEAPPESDLGIAGSLPPGRLDAEFLLVGIDRQNDPELTHKVREAFGTGCWDEVAAKVVAGSEGKLHLSGADLHAAAAPESGAVCSQPRNPVLEAVAEAIHKARAVTQATAPIRNLVPQIASHAQEILRGSPLGPVVSTGTEVAHEAEKKARDLGKKGKKTAEKLNPF